MGVAQTSELYKGFIFDGIDSKGYGVYISGTGVYNAPERDIEAIEIHGRNGAFILDNGRFKNITLTYPAGMFGDNEGAFADGIRRLRNALASRKGYCKLIDEYNPLEYRMAVYRGGLDVDPTSINGSNQAAQFEIQFECKPQRFLIDGDQPVKMTDGGTITNPTLFEARPLLQVYGYGDIGINGETVTIQNIPVGEVTIAKNTSRAGALNGTTAVVRTTATIVEGLLETGDTFTAKAQGGSSVCNASMASNQQIIDSVTFRRVETSINIESIPNYHDSFANQTAIFKPVSFVYGTSKTAYCDLEVSVTAHEIETPSNSLDYSFTMGFQMSYDGQNTITLRQTIRNASTAISGNLGVSYNAIVGISSKSALGNPLLIDLDIGEAYKEENGGLISSNAGVSLPAELPVLKSGANTIAFDNTITELDIVPRWWEV